jgi:hypothetical protein
LLLAACGGGVSQPDDTAMVQRAVDRGGVVRFASRTYHLTRTIVVSHSDTVIEGEGPGTIFEFNGRGARAGCVNDRVFTTPCALIHQPARRIAAAIVGGDRSFLAADDASDLQPGDWLIVAEKDAVIGDVVAIDWAQVESVEARVVNVRTPFRMAFSLNRPWDPLRSGLGFRKVAPLIENTEFRNFAIHAVGAGDSAAAGISVVAALHTVIDHVGADSFGAQPLYSYLARNLTVTASVGSGYEVLSEFAATVDLTVHGNTFSKQASASFGLDLGTAWFDVSDNHLQLSRNVGTYLLYGVHDGSFAGNAVGYVYSAGNAVGMLLWGDHDIVVENNYLAGGEGPESTAISVRSSRGQVELPSTRIHLAGNVFGADWTRDYEPGSLAFNN